MTKASVYTVKGLQMPLFGHPVIDSPKLVAKLDSVLLLKDSIIHKSRMLFKGFGIMKGKYLIKVQPDNRPYTLHIPRRIPTPLMIKVKNELP